MFRLTNRGKLWTVQWDKRSRSYTNFSVSPNLCRLFYHLGGSYNAKISCLYRIQNINKLDKNSITIFFLYIVQSGDRLLQVFYEYHHIIIFAHTIFVLPIKTFMHVHDIRKGVFVPFPLANGVTLYLFAVKFLCRTLIYQRQYRPQMILS